ncbi:Uncharacterized protein MJ1365 [Linum grandiflorum]
MNRLVPTFYRLHVSRSSAAAAAVMTNKLSLRSNQNSPVFHRFIRFAHQNAANRGTRKSNSNKKKKFWVPPESSSGGSSNPVRGCPELSRTVLLECPSTAKTGSCKVYVVGTCHVSEESCREVEAVIRFLKPEAVFLELCSDRKSLLTRQDLKIASKLEVFPGSEFRVASEEAKACGAKVILGDRPVQVTLQRTWRKMPLRHKAKLVYSLAFRAVFVPSPVKLTKMASLKEMEDVDMLTLAIREMSKAYPTLMETLVHERDQYMASMLHKAASEHSLVVAVVGRGHLPGIKKHWQQPVSVSDDYIYNRDLHSTTISSQLKISF